MKKSIEYFHEDILERQRKKLEIPFSVNKKHYLRTEIDLNAPENRNSLCCFQ